MIWTRRNEGVEVVEVDGWYVRSVVLYNNVVKPFVMKHQSKPEAQIAQAKSLASEYGGELISDVQGAVQREMNQQANKLMQDAISKQVHMPRRSPCRFLSWCSSLRFCITVIKLFSGVARNFFEGGGPVVDTNFAGIMPVYLGVCKNSVKRVLKLE